MKALQVALLLAAALAAAAEVGPPRCPPKYFFATGFNPTNSFDQIFDLRYYNLGKPYFVNEAHARCSKFPVYAHDLNNFGARFTRLCLDDNENARYSFRTPNPCLGGAEMWGEMFLSARPRTCKASQLEPVPNVWNRAGLSMNPSKQAPLKCPPAYTRAGPADKPLLKAFLSVYFTSSVFMAKTIDRYDNNMYCDDAFRSIDYSNIVGCIRKADAPKDKAMVVARGVITFRCYAPPVGAGLQTPLNTIGLTVRGMYTMQCKPKVAFKWSGPK